MLLNPPEPSFIKRREIKNLVGVPRVESVRLGGLDRLLISSAWTRRLVEAGHYSPRRTRSNHSRPEPVFKNFSKFVAFFLLSKFFVNKIFQGPFL